MEGIVSTGLDMWGIFNQTVSDMNNTANAQYFDTIKEVNAIQAGSIDSSDTGAYNLTMYGIQSVHDMQSGIIGPVSHLKSLSAGSVHVQNSLNLTIPQSAHIFNLPSQLLADPSGVLPDTKVLLAGILLMYTIMLTKSFLFKR